MLEKNATSTRPRAGDGQAEAVVEKIVNGKMEKVYEENCSTNSTTSRTMSVTIREIN